MKKLKYVSIILGSAIIAFGMYNVHAQYAISEGGVLGLMLLLQHWFHLSPAIGNLAIDAIALIAGAVVLKNSFLKDSLLATVSFSVFYRVFERFRQVLPNLENLPALAAILGGCFVGVGTILIVRNGCAAGADDTFALIAHAKGHIRLPTYYFLSDFSILLLSLTYIPLQRIVWSLLSVIVSTGLIAIFCRSPREPAEGKVNQRSTELN